jgi:hypothetical protein
MKKLGFGLVAIVIPLLVVLTPATTIAQGPVGPQGVATWTGEYFNNIALTGSPALARDDANIDFFWPEGTSPAPGYVNVNNYSVRWTRSINFTSAGNWIFNFVADDGVRIWVDSTPVIDQWVDQPPTVHTGTIVLSAGWHTVRVEYYNRTLGGTARLTFLPDSSYPDWKGEYFDNQTLAGTPVLTRNDSSINFDWGTGSPDAPVPPDHFSVRWTRTLLFIAGRWRFTTTTDDGVRVWVDSTPVIDQWVDQPPTVHTGEIDLTGGSHLVKMEYYENAGGAVARLTFAPAMPPIGLWRGEYFDNISLSGAPVLVRDDPDINFQWGAGSPGAPIPPDNFSVRWTTRRTFASGNYTFSITSDDGSRVWVDGALLIDAWYDRPPTTSTAARSLGFGPHDLLVEFYEHGGNASVVLTIETGSPPTPGEVIVDDRGAGWTMGGPSAYWHNALGGIGGQCLWTFNNSSSIPDYNWGRWAPTLLNAGNYEVFAYIPHGLGTTLNARYSIFHDQRYDLAMRSQALYADQWMSLGTYYFNALGSENVFLSDITYECYLCRKIVFDAVRFSPR